MREAITNKLSIYFYFLNRLKKNSYVTSLSNTPLSRAVSSNQRTTAWPQWGVSNPLVRFTSRPISDTPILRDHRTQGRIYFDPSHDFFVVILFPVCPTLTPKPYHPGLQTMEIMKVTILKKCPGLYPIFFIFQEADMLKS